MGKRDRAVIAGIEQVSWESIWLTYEGSAYACLESLEPEATLDAVMGLCGGAFRFFWHPDAGPWMCNYLLIGEEAVRRTFTPFGYAYTYVADYEHAQPGNEERYRRLIVESIDAGRPVIGLGVVGPPGTKNPEPCVVTGYDRGGAVLYGRSYFQAFGATTRRRKADTSGSSTGTQAATVSSCSARRAGRQRAGRCCARH